MFIASKGIVKRVEGLKETGENIGERNRGMQEGGLTRQNENG